LGEGPFSRIGRIFKAKGKDLIRRLSLGKEDLDYSSHPKVLGRGLQGPGEQRVY